MYKKNEFESIEEIDNTNPDIMIVKVEQQGIRFKIILVYLSVINKRPEDEIRNDKIRKEVETK